MYLDVILKCYVNYFCYDSKNLKYIEKNFNKASYNYINNNNYYNNINNNVKNRHLLKHTKIELSLYNRNQFFNEFP